MAPVRERSRRLRLHSRILATRKYGRHLWSIRFAFGPGRYNVGRRTLESGEATDGRSDRPLPMPDPQQTVKITTSQEEVELPYHVTPVDIPAYDQFEAELLKSSPNNKVPAIITLKVRTGPDLRFRVRGYLDLPACFLRQVLAAFLKGEVQGPAVADVPMGHAGPMLGQTHHFRQHAPEGFLQPLYRRRQRRDKLRGVVGSEGGLLGYFSRAASLMQPGHNLEGFRCTA